MSDTSLKLISESPEDTFNLGLAFGLKAVERGVIALIGPLGAGKTRFVQGLAKGLGINASTVNSPTYSLIHLFDEGRLSLCHIDLYRLAGPEEVEEIGIEEDFECDDGIVAVEWADIAWTVLPEKRINLEIKDRDENQREIVLHGGDCHHRDWIERSSTLAQLKETA